MREPAGFVHRTHDDAGEMIEIDRLALDQRRRRDQLIRGAADRARSGFRSGCEACAFRSRTVRRRARSRESAAPSPPADSRYRRRLRSACAAGETTSAMNWRSPSSIDILPKSGEVRWPQHRRSRHIWAGTINRRNPRRFPALPCITQFRQSLRVFRTPRSCRRCRAAPPASGSA